MFESEESDFHATWDCTACTFANRFEAFVCDICGTRKGTSTRKPRLNPNVVQQQALAQALALSQDKEKRRQQRNSSRVEKNAGGGAGSRPSSAASSHKKSPTREVLSPASTRGSHDNDESAAVVTMHKKDKIRNSLINRDAATEHEVRDDKNVAFTIVNLPSRHIESELKMIKVLREEDEREKRRTAKLAEARKRFEKERAEFVERRKKQREERAKYEQERRNKQMFSPASSSTRPRKTPGRKPKNPAGPSTSASSSKPGPKPRGRPSTGKPIGRPRNNPLPPNGPPPAKKR
uniref:RanBP2-type domain-containing protein n=1 Tax=Panagrellus redivivus TaxID=6233 RepID=A0A7E4VX05_PANRE